MPPLRRCWLAHSVLVAEQAHFVDGLVLWDGIEPAHTDEVFGALGIVSCHAIFIGVLQRQ